MTFSAMLSFEPRSIPGEDEVLRPQVREFLDQRLADVPADVRARSWMGFDREFSRDLGRRGWLGLTLPREYGGGGQSAYARFVVSEELLSRGAPVSAHWFADRQSGPVIYRFGSAVQKNFFLPKICAGELTFCVGMSEPDVGSDLASVRTRATRVEGGWRIKGRKIWTTNAAEGDYIIALVRTSGTPQDRHQGLSQIILDMRSAGLHIRPIVDLTGDVHFGEIEFDDVFVEDGVTGLLGVEGSGWAQVMSELAFERSGPERILSSIVLVEEWLNYLREKPNVADEEIVTLGVIAAHLTVLRSMSLSVTGQLAGGADPVLAAAIVKDKGTEFEQRIPRLISELLAEEGLEASPLLWKTLAYVTQIAPSYSLRGGTREILRGMIARGLGLR